MNPKFELCEINPPFEVSAFKVLFRLLFFKFKFFSLFPSFLLSFLLFFLSSFLALSALSLILSDLIPPNPCPSSILIFIFPVTIDLADIFLLYLSKIPRLKSTKSKLNSEIFFIKMKLSIWFLKL